MLDEDARQQDKQAREGNARHEVVAKDFDGREPRRLLRRVGGHWHLEGSWKQRGLTSTLSGRRCWRLGCKERSDRNQDDSACGPPLACC